jgi:hypothetical protein
MLKRDGYLIQMKRLLKELLKLLKGIMENVLAFIQKTMEILLVLVNLIDSEISAVANYILKKYD